MNIYQLSRGVTEVEVKNFCKAFDVSSPGNCSSLKDLRDHIRTNVLKNESKVVTIGNFKGGIGKTANAFVISTVGAFLGLRVLVIDMDPQANISKLLYDPHKKYIDNLGTISQFFYEGGKGRLKDIAAQTEEGLDIITGTDLLIEIEQALVPPMRQDLNNRFSNVGNVREVISEEEKWLPVALNDAKKDYDLIIIDTPPALGRLIRSVMMGTDHYIFPINTDFISSEAIPQIMTKFKKAVTENNREFDLSMFSILLSDPHQRADIQDFKDELVAMEPLLINEYISRNELLLYKRKRGTIQVPVWTCDDFSSEDFLALMRLGRKALVKSQVIGISSLQEATAHE